MDANNKKKRFKKFIPIIVIDACTLITYAIMLIVVRPALILFRDAADKEQGSLMFTVIMSILAMAVMVTLTIAILISYHTLDRRVEDNTNDMRITIENLQHKLDILGAFSSIYTCAYAIDLEDLYYTELSSVDYIRTYIPHDGDAKEAISKWLLVGVSEDEREKMTAFSDIDTIADRMAYDNVLTEVFLGQLAMGMSRASFIVAKRDEKDKPVQVIFAIQFVDSEFKREQAVEVEAEAAIVKAEKIVSEKNQFLINLSKNMGTPINGIKTLTGIAMTHIHEPDRVEGTLQKIEETTDDLMDYTKELINLARVEEGRKSLVEEKLDLSSIISDFCERAKERTLIKEQLFKIEEIDIQNNIVLGDRDKLEQAFLSLLYKNVKYTPRGGVVHFSIVERPSRHRGYACYDVNLRDEGMGMSESFLSMVFDSDSRDMLNETRDESSGLALNSVRNIFRMMEGELSIQSQQKVGTKYTATFYLKKSSRGIVNE